MPMMKKDVVRINVNVNPEIKNRLDEFAKENYMSQAAAVNLILKQFFDGKDALANMGNLTALMQFVSKKAGFEDNSIESADALDTLPERG